MSKPRDKWWGYVKDMVRAYPSRKGRALHGIAVNEFEAVRAAVEETERMENGRERMCVVSMVLWKRTHTLDGAALQIPCSERTAVQWHGDFIREVSRHFKCDGLS